MAINACPKFSGGRRCLSMLMLYVVCSSLLTSVTATFMVRTPEDNEIIFVGELITLQCEAPSSISDPSYKLLDGQRNTMDVVGFFVPSEPRRINFQITVGDVTENIYFCDIMENGNVVMSEQLNLDVRDEQPVCHISTGPAVAIGDSVDLSCYRNSRLGLSTGTVWTQITDGTEEELNGVESGLINQFKRKTSATVFVDPSDDGSIFQCVLTTRQGLLTCQTEGITVQGQLTASITVTNNSPLGRGESTQLRCESSDPSATISWQNNYDPSAVTYWNFANIIIVQIPETTTLSRGTVLTFTCTAELGDQRVSESSMISVLFPTTPATTVPPDFMVQIITDTAGPIGKDQEFTATCFSTTSGVAISWTNDYPPADLDFNVNGNSIAVSVPSTSTLPSGTSLMFTCIGSLEGRQETATVMIPLMFSTPATTARPAPTLEITSNIQGTVGINEEFTATCTSTISSAIIFWANDYSPTELDTNINGNTITVSVPPTTTLQSGTNLMFRCLGIFGLGQETATFMIPLIFSTPTTVRPSLTLEITSNIEGTIGINEGFTATCTSTISSVSTSWSHNYPPTDLGVNNNGNTITVFVPPTTMLPSGTNLVFTCLGSLGERLETVTFRIPLIFSTPTTARPAPTLEITTNNRGTIGINEEFTATCSSTTPGVTIGWGNNPYTETDIDYSVSGDSITVRIPKSTTLTTGSALVFRCLGSAPGATVVQETLEVQFITVPSLVPTTGPKSVLDGTSMTSTASRPAGEETGKDTESDQLTIYILIGVIVAITLVAGTAIAMLMFRRIKEGDDNSPMVHGQTGSAPKDLVRKYPADTNALGAIVPDDDKYDEVENTAAASDVDPKEMRTSYENAAACNEDRRDIGHPLEVIGDSSPLETRQDESYQNTGMNTITYSNVIRGGYYGNTEV